MIITKELKNVLLLLIMGSFLLNILGHFSHILELFQPQLVFRTISCLLFFGAIAYLTKDIKNALISFVIFNCNVLFNVEVFGFLLPIIAFSFFGYFHLKKPVGIWLGVVGLVFSSFIVRNPTWVLIDFWNTVFRAIDLDMYFTYQFGSLQIDLLALLFNLLISSFSLLIFWFFYHLLKNSHSGKFDFKITNLIIKEDTGSVGFSLVSWSLRVFVASFLLGNLKLLDMILYDGLDFEVISILYLVSFLLVIYIVSVVYRNFLTSYFIANGKKTGWMYYWLNIPFVNVFAWFIFISKDTKQEKTFNPNIIDDNEIVEADSIKAKFALAQEGFKRSNKNKGVQNFLLIMAFVFPVISIGFMISYNNLSMLTPTIISFFVSLLTLLFYLTDKKAVYYIYFGQVVLIFLAGYFAEEYLLQVFFIGTVMSFIINYPLFHLDQFTVSKPLETGEPNNENEETGKSFFSRFNDDFMKFDD